MKTLSQQSCEGFVNMFKENYSRLGTFHKMASKARANVNSNLHVERHHTIPSGGKKSSFTCGCKWKQETHTHALSTGNIVLHRRKTRCPALVRSREVREVAHVDLAAPFGGAWTWSCMQDLECAISASG